MSQNLYEEAIADARLLKEMAEQSAKNKIIDAVSPRIRQLIEAQILGEQEEYSPEEEEPSEEEEVTTLDLDTLEALGPPPEAAPDASVPAEASQGANISIEPDGEISLNVGDVEIEISTDEEEEDLVLSQEVAEALARIVGTRGTSDKRLTRRTRILEMRVKKLSAVMNTLHDKGTHSQKQAAAKIFESLLREAVTLRRQVILTEQDSRKQVLTRRTNVIIKEMNHMSRRSKNDIFDFLFEGEDVAEEPAAEEVDVDAASTALEDLGTALGLDVSVEDEGEEVPEEGGDELELGGEEEELDLEETYEIDEAALKRALRGMRSNRLHENDPVDGSGDTSFGGGDAGDEPFVEVDEDDLLNALADELGDVPMPDAPGSGGTDTDAMPESYRRRARRRRSRKLAETRRARSSRRNTGGRQNRALNGQLVEYKKAVGALKGQLTEMNLFNAKLLYANKLMQNRNLTSKQQRAIVEALDNAKTLREAKLLYKSLTNSLRKRGSSLNENRSLRSLGSASKSARSAKPITEGAGSVDRWAVLAGLGKDN
jgi:hypothetical protein